MGIQEATGGEESRLTCCDRWPMAKVRRGGGDSLAGVKRKPRRSSVDKQARESIASILVVLEDLVEQNERLWNSLHSAWVDIDILKDDGKLAKEARKLERELGVR